MLSNNDDSSFRSYEDTSTCVIQVCDVTGDLITWLHLRQSDQSAFGDFV
jgi:hypothetical protein